MKKNVSKSATKKSGAAKTQTGENAIIKISDTGLGIKAGIKILAVDDNEDNRVLFSIILKSLGADVRLAESAAEAITILNSYDPGIILSDISMPGEDGFSLLRKIQEKETEQKAKTPVIALTAHAGQEDIKRVLDAGFSAHIAKPVEKTLLSNVIKKLTST